MQLKKLAALFFLLCLLTIDFAASATSNWQESNGNSTKTRLLGSFYEKDGNKKLIAAIQFKIAPGWKIYGKDEGGIGLPPYFDFAGSKNYTSHQIIWPQALIEKEEIGKEVLHYSAYKNEVIVPLEIAINNISEPVELHIKLDYGLCKEICIPAHEDFSLTIAANEIDENALQEIQKFYPKEIINSGSILDNKESPQTKTSLSLISAILLAIIGGAILNIMPCVLPVLSLKLISILKHSNTTVPRIRLAFLSTIFGILLCFVILAFLASVIKITGNSLGWGLQFQNPYFLIFLIVVFILFIANLLEIFKINYSGFLTNSLNKKINQETTKHHIIIPNFLSGILAVLLATPCSAPFLGAAISFALVQSFSIIFLIFLFIGVGFALPYIILTISPKLVYFLPKPGLWMLKIKQTMVGLLIATIVWLIYIVSHNLGTVAAIITSILSIILLLNLKIKSTLFRNLALTAIILSLFTLPFEYHKHHKSKEEAYNSIWKTFDESQIHRYISEGKVVLVDVTADWCITCKFNKIRVLQDEEIVVKLKRGDIIGMRGDLTKPNEEILNFLHRHNRFAIPFNVVYGPNAKNGILLSELLNKNDLLKAINIAQ